MGVPARNLILGTLALPYMYALRCKMLALGNVMTDTYPDCNLAFRDSLSHTASLALDTEVRVVAPLADWENWGKAEEIRYAKGNGHEEIFSMTWTCWKGGDLHCGMCNSCKGRKNGFKVAGVADPIIYEVKDE